jgi:hypothetical protein
MGKKALILGFGLLIGSLIALAVFLYLINGCKTTPHPFCGYLPILFPIVCLSLAIPGVILVLLNLEILRMWWRKNISSEEAQVRRKLRKIDGMRSDAKFMIVLGSIFLPLSIAGTIALGILLVKEGEAAINPLAVFLGICVLGIVASTIGLIDGSFGLRKARRELEELKATKGKILSRILREEAREKRRK